MARTGEGSRPAPVLRLQKMYLKDLSFENPNAPELFRKQAKPEAEVNLQVRNRRIGGDDWEVSIELHATLRSDGEVVFIVEAEHAGLFLIRNVPEDHLEAVLAVECPTILFPFSRQIVSQAVVDGGFMPFLLEPVNFLGMYQSSKKPAAAEPH